ncbi:MAG TPA: T9SS type A sorting domain-containing protein [Bacteroidales bacterium]|nr:T9SS type A sorting domain-containing protein [Bacteroidales bacterium]
MKKLFLFLGVIMLVNSALIAQDTIVVFKFDTLSNVRTYGNAFNTNNALLRDSTFKAGPAGFTYPAGVSTLALSSTKWQGGLDSLKNYYTSFASTAYKNLTVSSSQRSSSTGPRDFMLQYKVDLTGTWTDVPGGVIKCTNSTSFFSLTNIPLPAACDSQNLVFLRWKMATDTSVGGISLVASGGTSRIDNIVILGELVGTVDTDPPQVQYVNVITADSLEVKFNEPVNQIIAENPGNFTFPVAPGNSCVSSSFYGPDIVRLKLSQNLPTTIPDTLYVNNIADLTGNTMTIPQKFPVMFITIPDTIAYWGFPDTVRIATAGIPANLNAMFNRQIGFTGTYSYDPGVTDSCLRTSSWATGNGTKYWITNFTTKTAPDAGYVSLKLYSRQKSTNSGPRNFMVEYCLDTTTHSWTTVPGSDIISLNDDFVSGTLAGLDLPSACDKQNSVYLRWIMTSDSNAAGTGLVTTGYNRIDDILITGIYSPDDVSPWVISSSAANAGANDSCDVAEVVFNEALEPVSASETANYLCTGGHNVISALLSAPNTVSIELAPALSPGETVMISINNVLDLSGNMMADTAISIFCLDMGINDDQAVANHISVFPNPFNDDVSVAVDAAYGPQKVEILVYNALGMAVLHLEKKTGVLSHKIDMSNFNPGIYYLMVNINDAVVKTEKLIKMQ